MSFSTTSRKSELDSAYFHAGAWRSLILAKSFSCMQNGNGPPNFHIYPHQMPEVCRRNLPAQPRGWIGLRSLRLKSRSWLLMRSLIVSIGYLTERAYAFRCRHLSLPPPKDTIAYFDESHPKPFHRCFLTRPPSQAACIILNHVLLMLVILRDCHDHSGTALQWRKCIRYLHEESGQNGPRYPLSFRNRLRHALDQNCLRSDA